MRFAAAQLLDAELDAARIPADDRATAAAERLARDLGAALGIGSTDLVFVFATAPMARELPAIATSLRARLGARVLLGCVAESVVGSQQEIERDAAVTVIAATLPGVQLTPFSLSARHLSEWSTILGDAEIFADAIGAPNLPRAFVTIADPFSTPVDAAGELGIGVLQAFNEFFPGVPIVGGLASGGSYPGSNTLILNDVTQRHGLIGVAISGDIEIDVIVSQGCRPIGRPYTITSARHNVILGIDGQRPMDVVQHMVNTLAEGDRHLLQTGGLYVGRSVRHALDVSEQPGRGDFLIRGVLGADSKTGGLMIGDTPDTGETVQFHVRDANTAIEDLELSLAPQAFADDPAGGLLFTCNGRGSRLYSEPDGDIRAIQQHIGEASAVPLAGFFCAGEIGPIGQRNYLHGHTASLILFRAPTS
jgi:small ligand-binding sensory domain FIST